MVHFDGVVCVCYMHSLLRLFSVFRWFILMELCVYVICILSYDCSLFLVGSFWWSCVCYMHSLLWLFSVFRWFILMELCVLYAFSLMIVLFLDGSFWWSCVCYMHSLLRLFSVFRWFILMELCSVPIWHSVVSPATHQVCSVDHSMAVQNYG